MSVIFKIARLFRSKSNPVSSGDFQNFQRDLEFNLDGLANSINNNLIQSVTATSPLKSSGGINPVISAAAATATGSGLVPTPPNNTTTFLRGDATWALPVLPMASVSYTTSSASGGSAATGSYVPYPINTVLYDSIGIGSISSNRWTLPAGTYLCEGWAMMGQVQQWQLRLFNVTDLVVVASGSANYNYSNGGSSTANWAPGLLNKIKFTITAAKIFELDYFAANSVNTNDLGAGININTNTYGQVVFTKIG